MASPERVGVPSRECLCICSLYKYMSVWSSSEESQQVLLPHRDTLDAFELLLKLEKLESKKAL